MLLRDLSSNTRLRLTGEDRVRFVNGLFTNDVAKLAPGEGCRAVMLTVKGKVVGDAIVLADADAIVLELTSAVAGKVREQLDKHLIVDDVVIDDLSATLDEVAVHGSDARAALERELGPLPDLPPYGHALIAGTRVVAVRELGLPGFRLIGGARALAERLSGGAPAWLDESEEERLRVEAGEPRYGADMDEDHLPIESRLDDAISHTKGCYMGQEVIARVTARGQINRRLMGLLLDGEGAAARGAKLSGEGREDAGTVTSSVVSATLGPIALAYVHRTLWAPGTVLALRDGGGERRAVVSDLPFTPTS